MAKGGPPGPPTPEYTARQLTTKQLRDELLRRDDETQIAERNRRDRMAEIYLELLPQLLQLVPRHESDRCSDSKLEEESCMRCRLLYAKEYNEWDRDQEIVLATLKLSNLETIRAPV
jgi:hypothetical protein